MHFICKQRLHFTEVDNFHVRSFTSISSTASYMLDEECLNHQAPLGSREIRMRHDTKGATEKDIWDKLKWLLQNITINLNHFKNKTESPGAVYQ